jgi:tRNA (adenine22-N1)-methyltransferase
MRVLHPVSLDARLSLVYDLYDACDLAADIGTDHARLPAALLQRGRCCRMILTDISPDALENARREIIHCGLSDKADLRLGDGLSPITEPCDVISITGMGGQTIRSILLSGRDRLQNASLVISAHTDWHMIRQTIMDIGYHLDREEPCYASGRYYLVLRARPGLVSLSGREIRLGGPLFESRSPVLPRFLERRRQILSVRLSGIRRAADPDPAMILQLTSDIAYLNEMIARCSPEVEK